MANCVLSRGQGLKFVKLLSTTTSTSSYTFDASKYEYFFIYFLGYETTYVTSILKKNVNMAVICTNDAVSSAGYWTRWKITDTGMSRVNGNSQTNFPREIYGFNL